MVALRAARESHGARKQRNDSRHGNHAQRRMTAFILAYLATALMYAGLAVYFWRTRWAHAAPGAGNKSPGPGHWEQLAVLVPLGLHAGLLYGSTLAGPDVRLGLGNAASLTI